jgi:hypothetical protein
METRRLQALLCKLIFCWTSEATSRTRNFINFRNWILANDIKYCDGRLKITAADLNRAWFALANIEQ